MKSARQEFDELAWDKADEEWEVTQKVLSEKSPCRRLGLLEPEIIGGFNNLYRIRVEGVSLVFWLGGPLCQSSPVSRREDSV